MIRKTLLFIALILCIATLAQAQMTSGRQLKREGRWDFSIQTRYLGGQDVSTEGGSSLSYQDNLGWGFGFGFGFLLLFFLSTNHPCQTFLIY